MTKLTNDYKKKVNAQSASRFRYSARVHPSKQRVRENYSSIGEEEPSRQSATHTNTEGVTHIF